jgi:hypothetical protein
MLDALCVSHPSSVLWIMDIPPVKSLLDFTGKVAIVTGAGSAGTSVDIDGRVRA